MMDRFAQARRGMARAVARLAARADRDAARAALEGEIRRDHGTADRLVTALAVVREAEALEPALPTRGEPTDFWARDRVVRRPEVPPVISGLVPAPMRSGWGEGREQVGDVRTLAAAVAAEVVVMGKFDVQARTKLRAGYGEERLTLAAQPPTPTGVDGIARAVQAHAVVGAHAPHLAPALLGHGRLVDGLPYVVERWLEGHPLGSAVQLSEAVAEILAGLAAVHRGHGTTDLRVSTHWPLLQGRWAQTVATGLVPEDLARWVDGLLARDGALRISWTHGDLVASNVMRTPGGIVLIDWEHSGAAPIMNDAAKLHLFTAHPDRTLAATLEALGSGAGGASRYSPAEELALSHAQLLSLYPRRSAKLVGHPRAEVYEKQVRRQVERLAEVHAAAAS